MKISTLWSALVIATSCLIVTPANGAAATISLNNLLTNSSFEAGVLAGCPIGWTCSNGNVSVIQPTGGQYPDPNGLPNSGSGQYLPDGRSAAFSPITGSATGVLSQSVAGRSYTAGNTYTLDFWIGNPLNLADPSPAGSLFPDRIDIQLTTTNGSGVSSNNLCDGPGRNATLTSNGVYNDNGTQCMWSLTLASLWPADGDWRLYSLSFTTNVDVPGDLGVKFSVFPQQSAENGALLHLDMVAPVSVNAVPEPATLGLLGMGLSALGVKLRRKKQR